MSTISNRFYITALEDGTTLHGNLAVDGSLTQGWNGTAAVPDWSVAANQPTIYLTLLSGATPVQPDSNFKWYYNGTEIEFGYDNVSTVPLGLFQKTTKAVPTGTGTETITMPALKIIDNLASGDNVDVDTITFKGTYTIDSAGIDFSASAQVRISKISEGGYLGVVNFQNGVADITTHGQTITMYARLFGGAGGGSVSNYACDWYVNDVKITATSGNTHIGTLTVDSVQYPALFLYEGDVTDHATIRCEFIKDNNLLYTAYAGVDDMQDPEFMYIQYNGNNGNAASLRKGETATFQIWVGARDDPSVLGGTSNPTYGYLYVQLLDGDAAVIHGSYINIPDELADTNGIRKLTVSEGKGTIAPDYAFVNTTCKKNLTGIVYAYSDRPDFDPVSSQS